MIIRKLTEAIRTQDWFTVSIEFVIVVAGIFVGLQVDDWNQERLGRSLEQEYLLRLTQDIQSDIAVFDDLEKIFEIKAAIVAEIRDLPPQDIVTRRADKLALELDYSNWKALPRIQSATYQELEASGRMILLSNQTLRSELSDYYTGYRLIQNILAEPIGDFRLMFHQSLPGERYLDMRLAERIGDPNWVVKALQNLRSRPGFVEAANAEIGYAADMMYYLREYKEQARSILNTIESDIAAENSS